MNGTSLRRTVWAVGAAIALAASPAAAQWAATGIGVAEVDTDQTLLLLAGISASPGGAGGIAPLFGVQGYYLTYDAGASRANVTAIRPYAGLRSGFTGGSMYGTVGYAFSNRETQTLGAVIADRGEGVVVSGGVDVWGTGGPLGYQALASYNFGSESFWGRGRVTRRLGEAGVTQRRAGAEVAFLAGRGYSAVQPGALLEFHREGGQIIGLGAGGKFFTGGGTAAYVKVETVLPLLRP